MWSASATRVLCGWTVVSAPDTHTECVASHTCCTLVSLPTCCHLVEAQSCPNPPKRGRGARLACSLFKERDQSHRTALKSFGSCTKCKGSTPAAEPELSQRVRGPNFQARWDGRATRVDTARRSDRCWRLVQRVPLPPPPHSSGCRPLAGRSGHGMTEMCQCTARCLAPLPRF